MDYDPRPPTIPWKFRLFLLFSLLLWEVLIEFVFLIGTISYSNLKRQKTKARRQPMPSLPLATPAPVIGLRSAVTGSTGNYDVFGHTYRGIKNVSIAVAITVTA